MPAHIRSQHEFVISYLTLRKSVGILGIALPVVLILGFLIAGCGMPLPPSISHYYYTGFGTFFTGTLCAVSLFLFSYNGPEKKDERAAMLAAGCALGVAFFPTDPDTNANSNCIQVFLQPDTFRNAMHYGCAGLLFLTLAYFSLVLFTKSSSPHPTREKLTRNKIYITCGWVIIGCVASIILLTVFDHLHILPAEKINISTFILEAIALFAFGISWLIKGDTFFKDATTHVPE